MTVWKDSKLGDISKYINRGVSPTYVVNEGITILNQKCIRNGRIDYNLGRLTAKDKNYTKEKRLLKNDIVINSTGVGTAGRVSRFLKDEELCYADTHVSILRINEALADPTFVFFNLNSREAEIEGYAEGSTGQIELGRDRIKAIDILLPPLPEQIQIAIILSSLDDKIDLLHRQNKTLEQLAETLFRQWFVEEAEEGEPSRLENWILFEPREKLDRQKTYQMFEMKCLSNTDMSITEGVFREVSSATTFRNGDTLLAKITPCLENGKTGFVMHLTENEIAKGSTEFIVMRTKGEVSPYWIYCLARSKDFHDTAVLSMTGTSGRQRVQIDILRSYRIKVDLNTVKRFHAYVESYFQKIKSNTTQIRTLTQLRDTLLPKLMSGEVRLNK